MRKYVFNKINFAKALKSKNMTVNQLSMKTGIKKTTLDHLSVHMPSVAIAREVCDALGVNIEYIWQTSDEFYYGQFNFMGRE